MVVSTHLQRSQCQCKKKLIIFAYQELCNLYIPSAFLEVNNWGKANQIIVMIAQSVSLGVLSLPSSMAVLGLVPYVQ